MQAVDFPPSSSLSRNTHCKNTSTLNTEKDIFKKKESIKYHQERLLLYFPLWKHVSASLALPHSLRFRITLLFCWYCHISHFPTPARYCSLVRGLIENEATHSAGPDDSFCHLPAEHWGSPSYTQGKGFHSYRRQLVHACNKIPSPLQNTNTGGLRHQAAHQEQQPNFARTPPSTENLPSA